MNGDGDSEPWLSGWEQQCADSVDEQPDFEQSLRDEFEDSHTRIWTAFQDSAAAIAQLYRGELEWRRFGGPEARCSPVGGFFPTDILLTLY